MMKKNNKATEPQVIADGDGVCIAEIPGMAVLRVIKTARRLSNDNPPLATMICMMAAVCMATAGMTRDDFLRTAGMVWDNPPGPGEDKK